MEPLSFSFLCSSLGIQAVFLPICHEELQFRERLGFKMAALIEKKHILCPALIFGLSVSFSFHLKAKSFVLKSCGCSLFVSRCSGCERSVLQLCQKSFFFFLAGGTTKANSKTSVIYRLTALNISGTLVPPVAFFKGKGESFFPHPHPFRGP